MYWEDEGLYEELIYVFNRLKHLKPVLEYYSRVRGKEEFELLWGKLVYVRTNPEYYFRTVMLHGNDEFQEEYSYFVTNQLRFILEEYNGYLSEADCSKIIYYLTIGQYFYDDKTWFRFINRESSHKEGQLYKWTTSKETPPTLGNDIICDKLREYFEKIIVELNHEESDKFVLKLISNIKKSKMNLGNMTRIKNITSSLTLRYGKDGMRDEMDKDGHIIGVYNGILDLGFSAGHGKAKPQLHVGYTKYYVSKTTRSRFDVEMFNSMESGIENSTHPVVQLVYGIYSGIIVEPDAFFKIMCFMSTMIDDHLNVNHLLKFIAGGSKW
ncbi:unnamed protein product [Ascophyllum nodosum]